MIFSGDMSNENLVKKYLRYSQKDLLTCADYLVQQISIITDVYKRVKDSVPSESLLESLEDLLSVYDFTLDAVNTALFDKFNAIKGSTTLKDFYNKKGE